MSNLARTTDPDTSHAAGESVRQTRTAQCLRLLDTYSLAGEDGLTSEEAARSTDEVDIESCWWHRVTDLQQNDYLDFLRDDEDKIVKRDNGRSGRDRRVYVITEKGEDALVDGEITLDAEAERKAARDRDERVLAAVRRAMEPPADSRFGTNLTEAEKRPATFAREIVKAWRGE